MVISLSGLPFGRTSVDLAHLRLSNASLVSVVPLKHLLYISSLLFEFDFLSSVISLELKLYSDKSYAETLAYPFALPSQIRQSTGSLRPIS